MRTLVDIPDSQINDLTALCQAEKLSRAEVIRQAIALYLEKKMPITNNAFGLWRTHQVDGLAYQQQVRSEWYLRGFLNGFVNLPIDAVVANSAVTFRKQHRIKLPDAIVRATASASQCILVTRNTKDFPQHESGIRISYQI